MTCFYSMKPLFSITLIFISNSLVGQYLGNYELTKGLDYTRIELTDTSFIKYSGHALNHGGFYSRGTIKTQGDTLILYGVPWEGMGSSLEMLGQTDSIKPKYGTHRKMDSTFMNLSLEIVDELNNPVPICIVGLISYENEIIATVLSDEKGMFYYWDGNQQVSQLRIGTLGYRSLGLDLKELRGYSTDIKIHLKYDDNNVYSRNELYETYLIDNQDSTITLIGKDSLGITLKLKNTP